MDDGAVLELVEDVARLARPGKRAKRVPPVPTPHEGTATRKACAARRERVDVDAAARELTPEMRRSRRRSARRRRAFASAIRAL